MHDQRLLFAKNGRAKYISHLDLMRTFQRAFLRAGLEVAHTEGFNPHAFVSIPLPLSVGYSSDCELLEFGLPPEADLDSVPERMNRALPEGITVRRCYTGEKNCKYIYAIEWRMTLEYDRGVTPAQRAALEDLLGQESCVVKKPSKKAKSGYTEVDIIPRIYTYTVEEGEGGLILTARISAQNPGMNPELILKALEERAPEAVPDFTRFHRVEIYDKDGNVFR